MTAGAQTIKSFTIDLLSTLNLSVSNLLTVTNAATLAGTLNVYGTASGGTEELMSYGSHTGTFTPGAVFPAGYHLSYGTNQLDLVVNAGPATWIGGTSNWNSRRELEPRRGTQRGRFGGRYQPADPWQPDRYARHPGDGWVAAVR